MSTLHTPGPWKVIETNYLPHEGDHVADMSNGLMVVPVMHALGDPLADARLIAAAPELLEALEWCADTLAVFVDDGSAAPDSVVGKNLTTARAAIAKATGEQA